MRGNSGGNRAPLATWVGISSVIYAATFFLGAAAHIGEPIPLGFATLDEPRIIPATIVETLCGIALLTGAGSIFLRSRSAWGITLTGHAVAIGGVLLGVAALALGAGPRTRLNDIYHTVILVALVVNVVLLLLPALRRTSFER